MFHKPPILLVQKVLPHALSKTQLKQIIALSSYIEFSETSSILFKRGEYSKGFYLILSGSVVYQNLTSLVDATVVGLLSFYAAEPNLYSTYSKNGLKTLFIDKRCYAKCFKSNELLQSWIKVQLERKSILKIH